MNISVVVPIYNESQNIDLLYQRLIQVFENINCNYEIIIVNDGSNDDSWEILTQIAQKNKNFKPINLARNFGQQIATTAGLQHCQGDYAFIIDGDLQHPPELFSKMLAMCEQDQYDSVYVIQHSKKQISLMKKYFSKMFYSVYNSISTISIPRNTGDFRIINRKMIDTYLAMPEHYRFIRGQFAWMGFKQGSIDLALPIREHGHSKFTFIKSLTLAFDGILAFSSFPIRVIFLFTLILFLCASAVFIYIIHSIIIGSMVLSSLYLFLHLTIYTFLFYSLGIIGEYIIRIYQEVLNRPIFTISEKLNFDSIKR